MRTIKFRAWNVENQEMIDADSLAFDYYEPLCDQLHDSDEMKFMQFTGLTDKNAVEIYEGDILGSQNTVGKGRCASHHVVSWYDSGFKGKQIGTYGSYIGIEHYTQGHHSYPYVVVGNIHQNPELLGAKR